MESISPSIGRINIFRVFRFEEYSAENDFANLVILRRRALRRPVSIMFQFLNFGNRNRQGMPMPIQPPGGTALGRPRIRGFVSADSLLSSAELRVGRRLHLLVLNGRPELWNC